MSAVDWVEVLDRLEADLDLHTRLIASAGVATVETWLPPAITEPLPAELADRARGLLWRQEKLAEQLRSALSDLARQRAQVRTLASGPGGEPPAAAYVDLTA